MPTRLRPPSSPLAMVDRPRLVAAIVDDPRPVTLVCGPAGAGKTSLLRSWWQAARAAGTAVGWVNLDGRDGPPTALWTLVLAALEDAGAMTASGRRSTLLTPRRIDSDFVDTVAAAIDARGSPVWLVLDDLHAVRDPATVASLELLVRRAPEQLRLVLSTRQDPHLGLERLRVDDALREIRMEALAFRTDEAAELLERAGLDLDDAAVEALTRRTEGWAAGLRIAAVALASAEDPTTFIERFGGDDHAVADYLVGEVLAQQPADLRTFLVRTGVCAELPVGLAARLTFRTDAAAILDRLEHDQILTVRVGRDRGTYRYHELLRTYLRAELERTEPGAVPRLHDIAATWYLEHGDPLRALEHLAEAHDSDRLPEILREHGLEAILDGHSSWLRRTLASFPDHHRRAPAVALVRAAAALDLEDLDAAEEDLATVDLAALVRTSDPWLSTLAATVDLERSLADGARREVALRRLVAARVGRTGDPSLDLLSLHVRGVGRLHGGDIGGATEDLTSAARRARTAGREGLLLSCLSHLAVAAGAADDLAAMQRHGRDGVALAERRGWGRSPGVTLARHAVAWAAYLWADDTAAEHHAALTVASFGASAEPNAELSARTLVLLASHGTAAERHEGLHRYRATYDSLTAAARSSILHATIGPLLVRRALEAGERAWAQRFADCTGELAARPGEAALTRALLQAARGHLDAAARELEPVIDGADAFEARLGRVIALLLAADLHDQRGSVTRAHASLVGALELAQSADLLRPFVDAGEAVHRLLVDHAGRFGEHEAFATRAASLRRPRPRSEVVALTATELELLRELPTLRTLAEIATARSVSVNTVKTHLRAVYRKLEVTGRRAAVDAGRIAGLL